MADMLTVTVGTTDYTFDWIAQEIHIENGVTEVMAADLKTAIHGAQDDEVGAPFDPIADFFNPVTLTATASTFLNVVLRDQWRIDSLASSGTLTVGDGNVVNANNGIDIFSPNVLVQMVNNTSQAGVLVTGGSGVTEQDKIDIRNEIMTYVLEDSETFEESVRLIRAEAAGTIVKSGVNHLIKSADGLTDRIDADADADGRVVNSTDGS